MAKKSTVPASAQAALDPQLMALVGQYLKNNGFHAAHQKYDADQNKAIGREERKDISRRSIVDLPPLETIFQDWRQEHSEEASSVSSSDGDTSNSTSGETSDSDNVAVSSGSEQDSSDGSESSSESSSESDSEVKAEAVSSTSVANVPTQKPAKSVKRKLSYSSSDSSDTSDGEDAGSRNLSESRPAKRARTGPTSSSSSSDENSSSASETDTDSDSDESSIGAMHKMAVNTKLPSSSGSSSSDSSDDDASDSESSSESASEDEVEIDAVAAIVPPIDQDLSDSSGTIMGDAGVVAIGSKLNTNEEAIETTQVVVTKQRHMGAHPTRLAQISAGADLNDYVSNTYVSYDYADKAYNDLSVTRGKGFTKEKNKKKRGSYRGGAIDISGGKAFKFDD